MNITARRKTWFTISIAAVLASLASIFILGLNLGLDFSGGARWDIQFQTEEKITQKDLKEFFASQEVLQKEVQILPSETQAYLITIEDLDDKAIQNIASSLRTEIGAFEQISYRKVDANIGASFQKKAFSAITVALIGMILFVAFAFRRVPAAINPWRFGGVAIIALFHDILIVLGIFTILSASTGMELDLPFVTALLATLGFSINDTIVILDRVRENIRLQKAHETFTDTVERSVQQTLRRSLFTSISTLFPLIALLFFGADAIFYFVLALTLGIAIGTYSSIFLAAPLLAEWKIWADKKS